MRLPNQTTKLVIRKRVNKSKKLQSQFIEKQNSIEPSQFGQPPFCDLCIDDCEAQGGTAEECEEQCASACGSY